MENKLNSRLSIRLRFLGKSIVSLEIQFKLYKYETGIIAETPQNNCIAIRDLQLKVSKSITMATKKRSKNENENENKRKQLVLMFDIGKRAFVSFF